MPGSGCPLPLLLTTPYRAAIGLLCAALLLAGCASENKGVPCSGQIETLQGQPLGNTQGLILDRVTAFTVTLPDQTLDSGPLWSADRQQWFPSAVTRNGWLAQRLSDSRFSIINSPQNRMITFTCPAPGTR